MPSTTLNKISTVAKQAVVNPKSDPLDPESSIVWSTLRERVSTLSIDSIDQILDLKDEYPIDKLEGVFAVASDSFKSEDETLSQLAIEGLKSELQQNFDDYCGPLKSLIFQHMKRVSVVVTSLEKEVKNVADVSFEVSSDVKESPNSTKGYLAMLGIIAFLIFLDMYAFSGKMETSSNFVYGAMVFVFTLFLIPI